MTASESARIVALLQGAFPARQLPDTTVEVYAMGLADLDAKDARLAVTRLVQTAKWLPTIAEIRTEIARGRIALPGPEEAWGIVRRAIGKHGSYRIPVWDCDEIHLAVEAIGWKEICLTEDELQHTVRARFCAAFAAVAARRLEAETLGRPHPASDRELPTGEPGDPRVLVQTGYPTWARRAALAAAEAPGEVGPATDAERLVADLAGKIGRR